MGVPTIMNQNPIKSIFQISLLQSMKKLNVELLHNHDTKVISTFNNTRHITQEKQKKKKKKKKKIHAKINLSKQLCPDNDPSGILTIWSIQKGIHFPSLQPGITLTLASYPVPYAADSSECHCYFLSQAMVVNHCSLFLTALF